MKVLVPHDGSERTAVALGRALTLVPADAEITLLCIQSEGFEGAAEDVVEMFDEDEDDEIFPTKDSAQRMLDEASSACKAAGRKVRTVVRKGNVRKEILAAAKGHDLVVMHRMDKSGLKEKLKMSGLEYLTRHLPCSVLLVDS